MQTDYLWTREEKIEHWGDGPWLDEPDRVTWEYDGVKCLIRRVSSGALCGYVCVQPGHPWFEKGRDRGGWKQPEAPGGITWTGPGVDGLWLVGFDCGHPDRDVVPEMDKRFTELGITLYSARESPFFSKPTYKHFRWVRTEVERLAQQAIDAFEASSANH